MPNLDTSIEGFLRSASEERVVYTFLDMLAERTAQLEQASGQDEIRSLRAENRRLVQRIADCEVPDIDTLLVFLPVIFQDVWSLVRADEIAILAHTLEVPSISSSRPEPTQQEVLLGHHLLTQLAEEQRYPIRKACQALKKHHSELVVRHIMQEFLMDL
ncbi:hypothetical protein M0220_13780 [Halomonas qinghailakensis]|uniref:Uncharacterized protein n=1 Tax=Halomonas qinghailakensis TaxID=2937790 RepID=A0AA46TPQ6_9GAMM|nr:hypothetical protein [Halomonas sp. ZZQ-149]UYO73933.1 hypothetical protein M0220_13780 [Halomonas sp. ZZQ-149]